MTARIGTNGDGNTEARALSDPLELVVLLSEFRRRQLQAGDEAVDVLRARSMPSIAGKSYPCAEAPTCAPTPGNVSCIIGAGFFFKRHALHQIVRAHLGRKPAVFVGIELPVLIEIATPT